MFESFFLLGQLPAKLEQGAYYFPLVFLSYAVACFASYTALVLAQQLASGQTLLGRRSTHWGGAFALGTGIWSMHFIGMLAYRMDMAMAYAPLLTLLSLLVAIASAYYALLLVARHELSLRTIIGGAVLLGVGISLMHYIGMAAMKMDADLRYMPGLFLLSIVIAIGASAAALWMTFTLARRSGRKQLPFQIGAAMIMGGAICGMHYTGMAAAVFIPYADCRYNPEQNFDVMAVTIALITGIILLSALMMSLYNKDKREYQPTQSSHSIRIISIFAIILFGIIIALMVHQKSERDYRAALQNYRKNSLDEAKISAGTLNRVLGDIYRDIRTISVLPSVRKIDLHGTNLDDDARESIQQIYNNLRSTVDVSEIYIVPVDFNPDAIDPVTHKLQKPILMFDEHIAAASSNAEALEEVETYEYRQLHQTLGWFKAHYPDHNHVSTIALPMVSGTPVITCDNTRFQKTRQDQDRTGIILSVPFYGPDKQLKGTISAILLNETLRKLLLDTDYALINPDYSLVISEKGGQDEVSQNWLMQSKPDPHLLYSAVLPLEVQDPRSHWALWVGFPDKKFL